MMLIGKCRDLQEELGYLLKAQKTVTIGKRVTNNMTNMLSAMSESIPRSQKITVAESFNDLIDHPLNASHGGMAAVGMTRYIKDLPKKLDISKISVVDPKAEWSKLGNDDKENIFDLEELFAKSLRARPDLPLTGQLKPGYESSYLTCGQKSPNRNELKHELKQCIRRYFNSRVISHEKP